MGTDLNDELGANAILNTSLKIETANDLFNEFAGDNAIYTITRMIHPADLDKFYGAIDELHKSDSSSYAVLRMLRFDNKYRNMMVEFQYNKIDESLISINMVDVLSIKNEIYELKDNCDTYKHFFSLMEYYLISYNPQTDKLLVFIMGSQRKINLFIGTLSDYISKKKLNLDTEMENKYKKEYEHLYESFRNGDKNFQYEIARSFSPQDPVDIYRIKGKTFQNSVGEMNVVAIASRINPTAKRNVVNLNIESSKDVGTDLINKRVITKYALDLLNSKPEYPITFAIVDLDNFKFINDTYGHMFGDNVLCKVAEILNEAVDQKGVVGRIGGDEMFIILENITSETELRSILRTIRMNVEWAYRGKLNQLSLSCSMGCATYPYDAVDYENLFNLADKCLYLAKEKGKNRYIIYNKEAHESQFSSGMISLKKENPKEHKIGTINSIIDRLMHDDTTLEEACEEIGQCFELEDISVFFGTNLEHRNLWSKFKDSHLDGQYLMKDNYINNFNSNNVFIIDNINFLDGNASLAYESMRKHKISASVQYLIGTKDNPIGFITFNKCKLPKKWSELDISYLCILAKILEIKQII